MRKICIFPNDPIKAYYEKDEIKERYFNPCNFFDEVHIITLCEEEVNENKVQRIAGDAKLKIYPAGEFKPLKFLSYRKKVLNLVRVIEPDVIRVYNPLMEGYLAGYCGKKLSIPSVLSLHGDYDEERDFRKRSGLFKFIKYYIHSKLTESYSLSNADKIICVTNFLTFYAKKHGAKDIEVIYNRVDTKQFMNTENNTTFDKITILCVGRLNRQKNQQCLIRAIKDLDVNLLLIGDGELYSDLRQLTKELEIEDRVKFVKSVPHSEIRKYYSSADIFAIATHYEGFCIPVLEAMASSLPVVVPNKEPLPEVVADAGIIVENNPESFEEAFKKLISNPELRKELGEKGRKRALEVDGKIMEEKEMDLYKRLIEKRNNTEIGGIQ